MEGLPFTNSTWLKTLFLKMSFEPGFGFLVGFLGLLDRLAAPADPGGQVLGQTIIIGMRRRRDTADHHVCQAFRGQRVDEEGSKMKHVLGVVASGSQRTCLRRKGPRPRKSAPGGSKMEVRGRQNGLLEGSWGWKKRALKPKPFLNHFWRPF